MNIFQENIRLVIKTRLRLALGEATGIFLIALFIAGAVNLLRPDGIPLLGFSSEKFIKQQQELVPEVSLSAAYDLYQKKRVIFIDSRDPFSFEEGHIAGAINIYPDEVPLHLPRLKNLLTTDFVAIVYCDGPLCPLSKQTAYGLLKEGIPVVKVLVDGWRLWREAGYPVARGVQ